MSTRPSARRPRRGANSSRSSGQSARRRSSGLPFDFLDGSSWAMTLLLILTGRAPFLLLGPRASSFPERQRMTMKTVKTASILLAAVLGLAARPATADTVVTGSIGRAFSGDLLTDHVNYGASIGFLGNVFGFEVEGTYSPDVFGDTPAGTNNITTLMGNVVLGAPLGRTSRLYASAGVGLMKFRVPDFDTFFDVSRNDFGMDAG